MTDENKYAVFLQYLARGPQPTHFATDTDGNYHVIFDHGLVATIAKAFDKHPPQVQLDARNLVAVYKRMKVYDEEKHGPFPFDPFKIKE